MATIRTQTRKNKFDYRRSMSGGDGRFIYESSLHQYPRLMEGMFQIRRLNFASRRANAIKKILWRNELLSCKCVIHMDPKRKFEGTNSEL
jgi:hypothetical protein